jgi:Fic family protein
MKRENVGEYVVISEAGGERVKAFIPEALPPIPALQLDENLRDLRDQSLLALGRLDSVSALLPDTSMFLYMYIRKEAVLSSQIEGTQSSLSDLLLFEMEAAPGAPLDDVREVSQYVVALNHGLKRLHDDFPLSLRLIREIHEKLLAKGRGSDKAPGEFRRSQNWVGGTRPGNALYVPPPADQVPPGMSALEKFLHDQPSRTPVLIKAALAHVQFESIHPFLDGNGRVGRLLITLLLCAENVLHEPLLYLSLYFKQHREEYYRLLQQVRIDGDWEAWLAFFLTGVKETAEQAVQTAQRLAKMFERDRGRLQDIGKSAGSALRVHHALQKKPILSIAKAAQMTKLSMPTTTLAFNSLVKLGLARELTGQRRNRMFGYTQYLNILSEGTEAS